MQTSMSKKREDPDLTKNHHSLPKINYTQDNMNMNMPFPYFGRGDFTKTEPFLVAKSLKPRVHLILYCHLIQRKRARLDAIGANTPIKVDLRPVLWVRNPKILRRDREDVIESKVSCKGDGLHQ